MKKEAGKGADLRSRLEIGETIEPVEEALDRLAERTYKRGKSIPGNRDVILGLFVRSKQRNSRLIFKRFSPSSVNISLIGIFIIYVLQPFPIPAV